MNVTTTTTSIDSDNEYELVLNRLRNVNLIPKDLPQHKDLTRASVLVPLFFHNAGSTTDSQQCTTDNDNNNSNSKNDMDWYILLTKRMDNMRTHSGEVCFPGGKQDNEDNMDDIVTALRETYEEVGIHGDHITPICRLPTIESYTGLCVTPIVGLIEHNSNNSYVISDPSTLNICTDEVDVAFIVPLQYFYNDTNLTSKYDVEWRGGTFEMRTYHYTTTDGSDSTTFKIWGLTAYIAHQVAVIAYGTDA